MGGVITLMSVPEGMYQHCMTSRWGAHFIASMHALHRNEKLPPSAQMNLETRRQFVVLQPDLFRFPKQLADLLNEHSHPDSRRD